MARRRRDKKGRSSVFALNRGASTRGRHSRLALNSQGGGFMAGRPAGGGGGVPGELISALATSGPVHGNPVFTDTPVQDNPVAPQPPRSNPVPVPPSLIPAPPPVYTPPPIDGRNPTNPIAIPPSLIPAPPPPPPPFRPSRPVPRAF